MVATEVEEIRSRDLEAIREQRPSTERCLRGGNRRLEKRHVPRTRRPAVRLQHLFVNPEYRFDRKVPEAFARQDAGTARYWP